MTAAQLDADAIAKLRRKTRDDGLTPEDRIALNLLHRRGVRAVILAKIFNVSKNTIYYTVLNAKNSVAAREAHAAIEREGEENAWKRYVTDDLVRRVNAELDANMRKRA